MSLLCEYGVGISHGHRRLDVARLTRRPASAGDLRILLGDGARRTPLLCAAPPPPVPHQTSGLPNAGRCANPPPARRQTTTDRRSPHRPVWTPSTWLRGCECWTNFTVFLRVPPCNKPARQTGICLCTAFHAVILCFVRVLDKSGTPVFVLPVGQIGGNHRRWRC